MIIKTLILTTLLLNEPAIVTMSPSVKTEVSRKRGKGNRGKRRGGGGLR